MDAETLAGTLAYVGAGVGMLAGAALSVSAERGVQANQEIARLRAEVARLSSALAAKDLETRTDALTGMPNRKAFLEELAARRTSARAWSLTFMDLDGFKAVNDTHGHDVGDAVLTEVGRRLVSGVGEHSLAARLHGDEFALVMPWPAESAAFLVERIMTLVACPMRLPSGARIVVRMSAGIVDDDPALSLAELTRRADKVLYRAKPLPGPLVWTGDADVVEAASRATTDRRAVRGAFTLPDWLLTGQVAERPQMVGGAA